MAMAEPSDHELELARNLVVTFIVTSHGIGVDYARRSMLWNASAIIE
jgi:hypothetical protein